MGQTRRTLTISWKKWSDRAHTAELDHAIAEFERAGVKNWIVQVPPQAACRTASGAAAYKSRHASRSIASRRSRGGDDVGIAVYF